MAIGSRLLRPKKSGNVEMRLILPVPMFNANGAGAARGAAEAHAIAACRTGDMRDADGNVVTCRTEGIDRTG